MKKSILALAAATLVLPGAAYADPPAHAPAWGHYKAKDKKYNKGYRDGRRDAEYIRNDTRVWRGNDGRYHCKRSDGTTGLIIGAAGGALVGRAIDTRGDRSLGTILGAAAGALLGRDIDRNKYRCG